MRPGKDCYPHFTEGAEVQSGLTDAQLRLEGQILGSCLPFVIMTKWRSPVPETALEILRPFLDVVGTLAIIRSI